MNTIMWCWEYMRLLFLAMTWDGVLGGIQKGQYDTASAAYMLNSDRYITFDFATPFTSTELMFVIGPSPPNYFRVLTIFRPTLTALAVGTLTFLLCGIFINQMLGAKSEKLENRRKTRKMVHLQQFKLHRKFRDKLGESSNHAKTEKMLLLLLDFAFLFFTGLYESCLLTYLLIPSPAVRMTESQILDLVYQKKLNFVISEDEYNK